MNSYLAVTDAYSPTMTMTMSKPSVLAKEPSYLSTAAATKVMMMHHANSSLANRMMMDLFLSTDQPPQTQPPAPPPAAPPPQQQQQQTDTNNNNENSGGENGRRPKDGPNSDTNSVQQSGTEKATTDTVTPTGRQRRAAEKYSLRPRSIQNRIEIEKKRSTTKREPKPKQKPPPLSKYRRKTANARERSRMREINQAFETLRRAVPQFPSCKTSEKLTKITTLRLAMNYIEALTKILQDGSTCDEDVGALTSSCSPLSHSSLASTFSSSSIVAPSLVPCSTPGSGICESSSSELGEYANDFLSEEGSTLGDPMDTFDDIIGVSDTFDILLESDGESLQFHSDLSDQSTP